MSALGQGMAATIATVPRNGYDNAQPYDSDKE
jgi:hypothetical protein